MHDINVHHDAGSTVMYSALCQVYTSVFWFHMVNTMIKMKTRLSWARGTTRHTEHSTSSISAMIRFFTSSMPVLIRFLYMVTFWHHVLRYKNCLQGNFVKTSSSQAGKMPPGVTHFQIYACFYFSSSPQNFTGWK